MNIRFWRNHKLVPHDDPDFHLADAVTLDFEFQKTKQRFQSITQYKSNHPKFCPVKAAAARISHMHTNKLKDTAYIFEFVDERGNLAKLSAKLALQMLRYYLSLSDFEKFGIIIQQVGLHSLRASMAMALHLKGHPPYTIKYLGQWASEAFLLYLCIHIEEFNRHLSESMITDSSFHLIPKPTHLLPISQPNNGPTLQGEIDNQCFHVWDFSGSNA